MTSALLPVMIIFAPIMLVLVGGQTLLEIFGLAIGTFLSRVLFVAQLAIGLVFLGGIGDILRRLRRHPSKHPPYKPKLRRQILTGPAFWRSHAMPRLRMAKLEHADELVVEAHIAQSQNLPYCIF